MTNLTKSQNRIRNALILELLEHGTKEDIAMRSRMLAEDMLTFAIARELDAGIPTMNCYECGNVYQMPEELRNV